MITVNESELTKYFKDLHQGAYGFNGMCYRAVWREFADQNCIIQAVGSFIAGGRYNIEAHFGVLYLSCDPKTSIEESVQSIYASPTEMAGNLPRMVVGLKVELSKVLKLTRESVLMPTKLRKIDLVDPHWASKGLGTDKEAITQTVGKAAKTAGFEAILVPSARRDGCNLNIFLDNLLPTSKISLINVDLLCPTDKKYEEACDDSLRKIGDKVKRALTDQEKSTLFCPKDRLVC